MTQETIKIKRFADRPVIDSGIKEGVEWCIYESPLGWWTWYGYARLSDDHPWRNQDLVSVMPDEDLPHPEVHGDISYGPDDEGWIGFDTIHAGDYMRFDYGAGVEEIEGHRWTIDEVREEIFRLIKQIIQVRG
ncbi:hypothetical protein [Bombiscardovia coagulans]|uniref:Uncharacterized protein n=1 Tax=Bombiscardovia coagulans TaxID=686666 RepID=A0A261ESQ3_9BIFI|nr:hypothetical protein [Bombiscardovia coagulans]OZG49883.1 hypothetical protein BOCO_0400 [Bombiscardovia coagulans]